MHIDIRRVVNCTALRSAFLPYTREAFASIPEMKKPRILDIGCGSGVPTIELAKLSDGEIIGVDIDQESLDELAENASTSGLSHRVRAQRCSLFSLDFPDQAFDIIWAEGVIRIIGFARGLREWRRLLKSNGFMVIHDDLSMHKEKLRLIQQCGYTLVNHFPLPDDAWWKGYYKPLEERIAALAAHGDDPELIEAIKKYQDEINAYKEDPDAFRSIFYIVQKTG